MGWAACDDNAPCNTDAEVVSVVAANVSNEVESASTKIAKSITGWRQCTQTQFLRVKLAYAPACEATLSDLPLVLSRRRVTAKGDNVTHVGFFGQLEGVVDLGLFHVGASQVHVCGDASGGLHLGTELESEV